MALTGVKGTAQEALTKVMESTPLAGKIFPKPKEEIIKKSEFYTGALARGNENVLGQCTRKVYINEFIEFWRDDYRAKAKCLAFLAIAALTFNTFPPFALFCIALAAKYWDWAMWCRNIARFNGWFRTIILPQ